MRPRRAHRDGSPASARQITPRSWRQHHAAFQTVTVPAGGAVIVELKSEVPGNYALVDHALARMERGLSGILRVEGPPNPAIHDPKVMPGMGH